MADLNVPNEFTKTFDLENPLTGDNQPAFFTAEPITIDELRGVCLGGAAPSVSWNVRYATDRSAAGTAVLAAPQVTTSQTTGDSVTSFANGSIPANNFVWLEVVSATAGVNQPDTFAVTLRGRATA